jgi:hypothetical protein
MIIERRVPDSAVHEGCSESLAFVFFCDGVFHRADGRAGALADFSECHHHVQGFHDDGLHGS